MGSSRSGFVTKKPKELLPLPPRQRLQQCLNLYLTVFWRSGSRIRAQSRYLSMTMTAKDKLRQTVEELSEAEAQDTLGFIVHRRSKRNALAELLERAPLDDEPTTPDEDEGVREAKEQIVRGEVLSADEIRREIA
jgi:hypothetical protein